MSEINRLINDCRQKITLLNAGKIKIANVDFVTELKLELLTLVNIRISELERLLESAMFLEGVNNG